MVYFVSKDAHAFRAASTCVIPRRATQHERMMSDLLIPISSVWEMLDCSSKLAHLQRANAEVLGRMQHEPSLDCSDEISMMSTLQAPLHTRARPNGCSIKMMKAPSCYAAAFRRDDLSVAIWRVYHRGSTITFRGKRSDVGLGGTPRTNSRGPLQSLRTEQMCVD